MQHSVLTPNEYRSIVDKARRNHDYSALIQLIRRTFSIPDILNQSFRVTHFRSIDQSSHNIDMDFLHRFYYETANNDNLPPDLLHNSISQLLKTIEVSLPQASKYLQAFMIILTNPHLYDPNGVTLLNRLVLILHNIPEQARQVLMRWLMDIDTDRLRWMVESLNQGLSKECSKLLPDPLQVQKIDLKMVTSTIMALCRMLELIYKGNITRDKIKPELFQNDRVNRHFDPKEQIKLHIKGQKILNFVDFPFLLSLEYKNKLLEYQTQYEHHINMQRGLINMMGGMVAHEHFINQQVNAYNLMYLHFQLHRNNLLDQSLQKLSNINTSLKNPLKITFIGEPGDDGGGVKKEYFQLIIKEIFNPCRDMFLPKNNNRFYWFNGESFEAPIMFEFMGMLLGLSIYNRTLLNLSFPKLLYKKLLLSENEEFDCLSELTQIQPDFQISFKYILSTAEPLESMELTFEAQIEVFGERIKHPLKPGGHYIKLTQANKHEYVKLYSEWLVNKSIQKQFKAFRRGFYRVVTGNIIKVFLPNQLERIICGDEILDFRELEKVTKYESGYTSHTYIVRALWELIHSWDIDTKKAFIFFTTGSDRAPIGGLGKLKFVVERHGPDSNNLPTAHTCSNVFLLPEYNSKHKLKEKLELALKHKEGFGLI